MVDAGVFSTAFLIGFLPVLVWLVFWLWEDGKHPEPKRHIVVAFVAGLLSVLVVIPIQKFVGTFLPVGFTLVLLWAGIEEAMKLLAAWFAALRSSVVDEPIDIPIYLITVALGFAALENLFFLLTPLAGGQLANGLITGNLRFIGATLIHVLSSASIGVMLALAYFKSTSQKILYGISGLILAISLHTLFNFSIIKTGIDWLLTIFAGVWVGITFLLLMLENVKRLKRPTWWQKMFIKK